MAGCQEVAGLLQGLADGDLPAGDRTAVEAHISGCPSCTKEAARLRENAAYLQEVLGSFRMPPEFPAEFLLALPRKDGKRRGAAGPAAPPKSVVMGATSARGLRMGPILAGAALLCGAGFLGWLFLGRDKPVEKREWKSSQLPDVQEREDQGKGAADGRKGTTPPPPVKGGKTGDPAQPPPPAWQAMRTAQEFLAAVRAAKGDGFGAIVARGWDLLAGTPAEAAAVRDAASAEKDARLRAAMVLALAADGREETRTALRGFLADGAPEVRTAAALGLARSLSYENPAKRAVPSGPPLSMAVQVGALEDDPARAELAGRLALESEDAVRRILVQVLGPSAGADARVLESLLDGVKGAYGDEMRETCVRALSGVQDKAIVAGFAEALGNAATPKALHGPLVEGMLAADREAAVEALTALLPSADGTEFRRSLVEAVGRAGGGSAEGTLLQVLANDAEPSVRVTAAAALQRFPSRAVLDALQAAVDNDADQMVRVEAERVARIVRPTVEKAEGGSGEGDGGGGDPPAPEPQPQPEPPPDDTVK